MFSFYCNLLFKEKGLRLPASLFNLSFVYRYNCVLTLYYAIQLSIGLSINTSFKYVFLLGFRLTNGKISLYGILGMSSLLSMLIFSQNLYNNLSYIKQTIYL